MIIKMFILLRKLINNESSMCYLDLRTLIIQENQKLITKLKTSTYNQLELSKWDKYCI